MTPKSTETKLALFDLKFETMEKDLKEIGNKIEANHIESKNAHKEIKEEVKANHKEILELFNSLGIKFATKEEHKANSDKIAGIIWVGGAIFVAVLGALVNIYIK